MDVNGMNIGIDTGFYNKTTIGEDGRTHKIDVSKEYPYYQLGISKTYIDVSGEEELIDKILEDLNAVVDEFEKLKKNKMQQKEEEKEPEQ